MKKIVYLFVFVSLIVFSIASSCKKPKDTGDELPTGENTMYFYVDGKLFIPEDSNIGGIYAHAINYSICDTNNSTFDLNTTNLLLHFYNGIQQTGKIVLKQSYYNSCQVHDNHGYYVQSELWNDGIYHTTWYYTHDGSGTVNITYLSADKKHFKGTFEMTVYHENTGVEKHITDGHFNINLNTLNQ